MPNSPTIVSAALSDKDLQDSINKMVANFDKGLQDMLDHSNKYVEKIQESLQKIGNTNFGAKGSNDGGVAKQTKEQKEATNEAEKRVKKEKEINLTLDQRAEIMGRMPREMRMPDMAKSARESFQAFYKGFNEQARQLEPLIQSWERLLQSRHTGNIEQIAQQIRNVKSEIAAVIREQANLSKTKPQGYIDEIAKRNTQIKALRDQLVSLEAEQQKLKATDPFKGNPYLDTLREKLQAAKVAMNDIDTTNRQWLYRTNELTEAQRKLATESMKSFYAHTMKMPTDQYDVQLAKLENIRALLQRVRSGEATFFTPTQITGLEKEERRLVELIGQVNTAQQQTTQSAQRYTEEVRKQAQAIRESQQWKEKGFVTVGNDVFYDPARSKAQTLSLEEQMLNAENRRIEAQEKLNAESQKEVEIKSQLPKQGYLFDGNTRDESSRQQQSRAALERYKQIQQEEQNVNSLNAAIMRSLHIGKDEVKNYDIRTASAKQLNAMLKQQRDAYANLTTSQRSQKGGVELAESIQRTVRALQKLQAAASRPISLQFAMGLSEKTLDEMAYKMRQLASYRSGLNIKTQANEIEQVNRKYAELQKSMNDIMRKNTEMIKSNTALGRSWNYMKNRLAFYFTVGASTQFVKNLIEVRSQYEMNERALGILIDSAERGTRIFNELSQMALVSPYTLIELSSAAKQLTAYDVAAKDVVDTTRRLADMAAAVGIPIERLTYALGQIKAYGYLNARDARMFSNAGIPLVKQLAEHYTELEGKMVSTADVYDRIKKKAIDMTDVMQVINKMTDEGGKFFDFQAKMAGTLKVQLANLTLAWNNMLNDIGASEQGTISTGIGLLKELFLQWKNISKMVTNLAIGFGVVKAAQLAYYGVVMGTNKAIALETVLGNRLSNSLRSLASSTNAARMSSTALWVGIATFAAAAVVDILRGNEAMKEFNKTLRENAENTYNDLKKFSENYSGLRESLYKTENGKQTPVDINSEEAKKAWEVLREQIELSSHASDEYISRLLSIENVSERLRQGFAVIDSIQAVSAAIKEIGDSAIKLERDWSAWWNLGLLPDGTIGNLQDAYMWLSKIEEKYGSVVNARKVASTSRTDEGFKNVFQDEAKEFVENYETELEKFRKDIQVTKQSIIDFIELKGWSGDTSKINEAFKTFTDNLILKNQLNPQQAYTLQLEMEEARSKAAKEALLQRINDERAALKISHDDSVREALAADIERYKNWDETNGRSKVEWERFTKWLKEQHISETTAMFRNMDAEDIRSLNFQEGKHAEWVKRMVTQYAKEHKMSYDDAFGYLKSWVTSANQWSIFIPMTISTEDPKTVYKQLGEYDKAIDDADAQIERLTKRINELNAKKKKSKEETKELADAEKELTRAQKDKADAEAKGGHGKKEKKDERAANKAAKQAESELAKALKDELSTIEKVRSIYKDLTKEGMSHANAVERATRGWDETVNAINRVLQKNGLQKLNLSKFAGIENPRELVNMLQSQLNTLLKSGAKPAEIKELQTKVNTLEVDADKYDLTKITKGLNNELGKLKDEYELAVELDADPELGGIFADMMGLNKEQLSQMPKDFDSVVERLQKIIDNKLGAGKFNLIKNLNKASFDAWLEANKQGKPTDDALAKSLESIIDYANKVRLDSSKKQIEEWNKLLEKYAEYEYKVTQIQKEAERERETARKKGAGNDIFNAINNREKERLAQLDFEQFQKSPEWITATGNLANMSKSAIGMLIAQIELYKKTARNLSPKQIKEINKALKQLYAEQRKNNPFKAISNMLAEAKDRMANFEPEIEKVQKEIDDLQKKKRANIVDGIADEETDNQLKKAINRLKELKEEQEKSGKVDASAWVGSINETISAVKNAVSVFDDLAKAIGGVNNSDVDKVFSVLESAGSGAATGAQIGGAWGAVIGAVVGAATSLISIFAGAADEKIVAKIEESERAVKRLENAYKQLEYAIDEAFGTNVIGAKQAAIANKELQLVELERQLRLEKSRDSKNRDEERIETLKGEIIDLRNEIKTSYQEVATSLLGISSVGDAALEFMDAYISALRKGEDAQAAFTGSYKEMIASMIKQLWVTKVIGPQLESIVDELNNRLKNHSTAAAKAYEEASRKYTEMSNMSDEELVKQYFESQGKDYISAKHLTIALKASGQLSSFAETLRKQAEKEMNDSKKELDKATTPTIGDMDLIAQGLDDIQPIIEAYNSQLDELLKRYDLYDTGDKESKLSALQQGIQGITEDTAGALEAYMNGVSQQVYLHSDLLTQIRDAVVGIDIDVQVATQAQMLLQLQQSYAVQMAIQGILEGALTPSGRAFSVELVS